MKKELKDKHFIKQPWYEGGIKALKKFITENLRYPPEAVANKIEGTVYLKYDIDYKGYVTDVKVIKSLGFGCDEEAIRLVKMLRFQVEPPKGLRVIYHKDIQIHFRLPKSAKLPQPAPPAMPSLQYHYVPAGEGSNNTPADSPQTNGYTITIQW